MFSISGAWKWFALARSHFDETKNQKSTFETENNAK